MFFELIRAAIQKIFQDKILLGLVIVGILAIFVGNITTSEKKPSPEEKPATQTEQANKSQTQAAALTPQLAVDFIKWWLSLAMDYKANSAQASHQQAFAWATPEAARGFQACFWTPELASCVEQGKAVVTFQLGNVQAQAINPDGTIVVGVSGTVVIQAQGQPATQQLLVDFLVKRNPEGLRVAGLYNHSTPAPAPASVPTSR